MENLPSQPIPLSNTTVRVFKPFPVTYAFLQSNRFITAIIGPMGSGKSSACVIKIWRYAANQKPSPDGIRRTRWAIIRNTYPELKTTTLNTWTFWFPDQVYGRLKMDMPISYTIKHKDIEAEILFLALNQPEDVRKLLSLDLTGAWINEFREIPETVLNFLEGRVGRYPAMQDGGPTWHGIMMDTNPPEEDSWFSLLEAKIAAARDNLPAPEVIDNDAEAMGELDDVNWGDEEEEIPIDPNDYEIFHQPSGLSPEAENIPNLPDGYLYYKRLARGKPRDFVQSNVHGLYSSIADGAPVYPEFMAKTVINGITVPWHVSAKPLEPIKSYPLYLGWDYGLTPALVIAQITPRGQLIVLQEITSKRMGIKRFVQTAVRWHLANRYKSMKLISTGDTAGNTPSPTDEVTCHQILADEGIVTDTSPTNSFMPRREAVAEYLNRSVDGQPGMVIDPRCRTLIDGFRRGYRYKRVKVEGENRFTEKVDKNGNRFTHPHDALQYLCLRIQLESKWDAFDRSTKRADAAPVH